jgi:hypothetical protein
MGQLFGVSELFAELSEGAGVLRRHAPSPMMRGLPTAGVSAISLLVANLAKCRAVSSRWPLVCGGHYRTRRLDVYR